MTVPQRLPSQSCTRMTTRSRGCFSAKSGDKAWAEREVLEVQEGKPKWTASSSTRTSSREDYKVLTVDRCPDVAATTTSFVGVGVGRERV
jgi:hypothetical protein